MGGFLRAAWLRSVSFLLAGLQLGFLVLWRFGMPASCLGPVYHALWHPCFTLPVGSGALFFFFFFSYAVFTLSLAGAAGGSPGCGVDMVGYRPWF